MKKLLSILFLLPFVCSAQIWTQGTNFHNFGSTTNDGNFQTATANVTGTTLLTGNVTNSPLTASRMVMSDPNKALTSAAASGAVPLNADGSATTAAQVSALGVSGYTLTLFSAANQSPVVNSTYFFGACPLTILNTTYATCAMYVPKAMTIKTVWYWVQVAATTATTGQGVTSSIRLNNSTDFASTVFDWNQTVTNVPVTGISQAVNAGDTIAWKIATPAVWTTTPTTCRIFCLVYGE